MTGFEQKPGIQVYAQDRQVGTLTFSAPHSCEFQYTQSWRLEGYPISPHIPLNEPCDSAVVVRFLRNLFPEGSAFERLLESENLSKNNVYAILNTIGGDTTGVLTFGPKAVSTESTPLRRVTKAELIERLQNNADMTFWDGKYRLSVAGVQKKLNIYIDADGAMHLAAGRFASSHILKFSSAQYPTVVVNELYCMRLAKAVGLDVAAVRLVRLGDFHALAVTRFDRRVTPNGVTKRHIIDGCQALDMPPEYKYEQNFGSSKDVRHIRDGASFAKLFAFAAATAVPALSTQKIIDWMIFNLIIGNSDAHGKNISFYVSGQGGLAVTPFYDLVSVVYEAVHQPQLDTSLAMAIDDNFDIHAITAFDLLSLAFDAGIKFDFLQRRIERIVLRVQGQAQRLDFSQDDLATQQERHVRELADLVVRRSGELLKQARQFKQVYRDAFR
ncbi:HipA domain-containing protein [Alkalimonas delamerensis]|uniref:HipA domain-containing protein n=1 Tax=Alkalimonas delamerensis TaxID=265981 RepID=A0ABT9GRJ4_9GAMM|nr:HipA domain-containing protein [Alkalimonas delamerensis]MDP4529588.1 HipA domain-containing protein [Alkalimonas delamerensis]